MSNRPQNIRTYFFLVDINGNNNIKNALFLAEICETASHIHII